VNYDGMGVPELAGLVRDLVKQNLTRLERT
jgi:hypothetical protein